MTALQFLPLSPGDLANLLRGLAATDRAALAWAPQALKQAIRPLEEGPLTEAAIQTATREVTIHFLVRLWPRIVGAFEDAHRLANEVEALLSKKRLQLRHYFGDGPAFDAADWVLEALLGVCGGVFETATHTDMHQQIRNIGQDDVEALFARGTPPPLLRAYVLLIAILDCAEEGRNQGRASELADLALLNAAEDVGVFATSNIAIRPFATESPQARGQRLLRYADNARKAVSEEEIDSLLEGRLHSLR